jgi:hypothetical protein
LINALFKRKKKRKKERRTRTLCAVLKHLISLLSQDPIGKIR